MKVTNHIKGMSKHLKNRSQYDMDGRYISWQEFCDQSGIPKNICILSRQQAMEKSLYWIGIKVIVIILTGEKSWMM